MIKEVNLGPSPQKASPSKVSRSKASPSRASPSKLSPYRRRGDEPVNKLWEALKEAKNAKSPEKKKREPRESPTKRLREMKNTSLKNKQELKRAGESIEGKMLYTIGPNAGYLVTKESDSSMPIKDMVKKDHSQTAKFSDLLVQKLGLSRKPEESKEGELEDFANLFTPDGERGEWSTTQGTAEKVKLSSAGGRGAVEVERFEIKGPVFSPDLEQKVRRRIEQRRAEAAQRSAEGSN